MCASFSVIRHAGRVRQLFEVLHQLLFMVTREGGENPLDECVALGGRGVHSMSLEITQDATYEGECRRNMVVPCPVIEVCSSFLFAGLRGFLSLWKEHRKLKSRDSD